MNWRHWRHFAKEWRTGQSWPVSPSNPSVLIAIGDRWPKNFSARMGLGNAYYALGDYPLAEDAFRQAVVLGPGKPDAWNNLAYAIALQGRKLEAVQAAHQAIKFAGDDAKRYQATLRDVSDL